MVTRHRPPATATRRLQRGAAAAAALAIALFGVPAALWYFAGNPLPGHLPTGQQIRTALFHQDNGLTLLLHLIVIVGWLGSATFAISVLLEVAAQLTGDPGRVDSDLWRLHQHLHTAAAATTDTRTAALQAAVAAYAGPLAADHDYYWIPPIREATRRPAIDAHVALAELLADTDPAAAIAVIEQAIGHDPYNETLYQHPMRLHAAQRAFPAVAALRNRLVREIADIGTSPTADSIRRADDLLSDSPTHPR